MARWKFRMYTEYEEDGCWVSGYGETKEEAMDYIMSEYWGVTKLECYGKD